MKAKNAKKDFQNLIKKSGTPISSLTPAKGIRLMLDFYRDVRADKCELDEDRDMLLFQWGTYNFSDGESFQFNLTRQFIVPESEDDDCMSQLSFTFHFPPSPQLANLKSANQWCSTPDDLENFESFITASSAYEAVANATPAKVTLEYGDV